MFSLVVFAHAHLDDMRRHSCQQQSSDTRCSSLQSRMLTVVRPVRPSASASIATHETSKAVGLCLEKGFARRPFESRERAVPVVRVCATPPTGKSSTSLLVLLSSRAGEISAACTNAPDVGVILTKSVTRLISRFERNASRSNTCATAGDGGRPPSPS